MLGPYLEKQHIEKAGNAKTIPFRFWSKTFQKKLQEHFFPIAFEKFSKIRNVHEWEAATFDFLESVALRIETKNGRLVPTVVASEHDFNRDAEKIVEKIEAGPHFRFDLLLPFS